MDITKFAILKKLAGGGGGGSGDHTAEDAIVSRTITDYTNDRVTSIGANAFQRSKSLVSVNFPVATSIGESAFRQCTSLTSINIPAVTSIGIEAFVACASLTSVNFPAATSISSMMFNNCASLTSVNFPAATSVAYQALSFCPKLVSVDLPVATSIDSGAFYTSRSLTSLILRNTEQVCTLSSTNVFNETPIKSGTGYIYVPAALVDSYKTATNWTTYADQFRALESYTVDGTTTGELDPTKVNA